jgi:hypothetical protein
MTTAPRKKTLPSVDVDTQITLLTHAERNPTGYEPFADADRFVFDPDAAVWSRVNAWWLAEASWLSYFQSEPFIQQAYQSRAGMNAVLRSVQGTDFTVAWNQRAAIVAFRGTQPDRWEDIFSDALWAPIAWRAGHVHKGFALAIDTVWPALQAVLDDLPSTARVWFTGHSLGAALATLAAFRCGTTAGVYTFGCPLVGNQVFAGSYNMRLGTASARYVNDHDIVTRVPPEEFAFPFGRYTHVDAGRWIDRDGGVHAGPGPGRFFSDVVGQPAFMVFLMEHLHSLHLPALPDALRDHTPLHYAIHVWNDFVANWRPDVVVV